MKDYFGYKDKICVVTGAASGMGKAATEMLVDLDAKVYALDWAEVTSPGIEKYIQVNLAEKASIDKAFKEIPGEIDCFFGIAGVAGDKHDFHTTFTIDFIANKYITQEYLATRVVSGGAIAFITSTAGWGWNRPEIQAEYIAVIEPVGWEATYAAMEGLGRKDEAGKFAYRLSKRTMNYYIATILTEFLAKEIRVNAVLPGPTISGLTDSFAKNAGGMDNLIARGGVAKRLAESREMGEPIVFLNSNMASYMSGVMLDVDFGKHLLMEAGILDEVPKPIWS